MTRRWRERPFSKGFNPQFSLAEADVIVSLDADFLSGASYPGSHKLIREYAKRRKLADGDRTLNRLYVDREHAEHDGHEGRAPAGAAGERDSGLCGGAGGGGWRCGRFGSGL